MTASGDVFGLGHCCIDCLALLDPYPDKGRKGEVVETLTITGGPIPTALQAVVKFGGSAGFCGKVGDDADGQQVRAELRQGGLDISTMVVDPSARTAKAYIWIDRRTGERTVALDRSGLMWLKAGEFNLSPIRRARLFYTDAREQTSTRQGLETARDAGVATMLDCGADRSGLREMMPLVDIAAVSHEFADSFLLKSELIAESPVERSRRLAEALLRAGAGLAVVTVGERGVVWLNGSAEGFVPGFTVQPVVDTTGAGDVFHAGFIHGWLRGWAIDDAVRFGNAAAALSVRKLSGARGIPELAEVETLVGRQLGCR